MAKNASARVVPVERVRHSYEARTRVGDIETTVPLVDREQVNEWKQHFTGTAEGYGFEVDIQDVAR